MKVDEVGHRVKRVRHQIQVENYNKRAGLSELCHGIHLGRARQEYSNND